MQPSSSAPGRSIHAQRILALDPHRPHYHFTAPANWLNDPNGLIDWKGTVHLFYQHNPNGPFHGTIHWGHASSVDLVHWRDHPIALAPTPGGPDADGCWSGCAVDDQGTPTLLYTGVSPQAVCLAVGDETLETWRKYEGNPVISAPPPEIAALCGGDFRDPFVWREDDAWWMVIGSRREGVGGLVLLYRSADLRRWEFVRILLTGDEQAGRYFYEGAMWECPNLLDFGERRALVLSVQDAQLRLHHAAYFTGVYWNQEFTPSMGAVLAYGDCFYAPQATRLADGRYLLFGWLRETRSREAAMAAGWSGCMSLPLIVTLRADGRLALAPAQEVEMLRSEAWSLSDLPLGPHTVRQLDVNGNTLEIEIAFVSDRSESFGVAVRCSPDDEEQTRIVVRPQQNELHVERVEAGVPVATASMPLTPASPLALRIFVDASTLEIFTEDGRYLATRLYPRRSDSTGVRLFTTGASINVRHLKVWRLTSIWR
ncbi:MAG: glycoside hydrolase family 32 protein [Caldilinea sp.]|nr:glycoside hydrolase family 32 protein [Caldilinea sp.]MDW8441992.1 glycoside hydrolase family 32 protein [Caldilineaceae bacterium]